MVTGQLLLPRNGVRGEAHRQTEIEAEKRYSDKAIERESQKQEKEERERETEIETETDTEE